MESLHKFGGIDGIADSLQSDLDHGIEPRAVANGGSIENRKLLFGQNELPTPESASFFAIMVRDMGHAGSWYQRSWGWCGAGGQQQGQVCSRAGLGLCIAEGGLGQPGVDGVQQGRQACLFNTSVTASVNTSTPA